MKCKICKNELNDVYYKVRHITKYGKVQNLYYCNEQEYNDYIDDNENIKNIIGLMYNICDSDKINIPYIRMLINNLRYEENISIKKILNTIKQNISTYKTECDKIELKYREKHIMNSIKKYILRDKITYVYKINCKLNNKSYIGVSTNISKRLENHISNGLKGVSSYCNNNPAHKGLYVDMYRFGMENFSFDILCSCTFEERYEKEKFYIEKYDTFKNGYNVIPCDNEILEVSLIEFLNKNRKYCCADSETLHFYKNNLQKIKIEKCENKNTTTNNNECNTTYIYLLYIDCEEFGTKIYIGSKKDLSSNKDVLNYYKSHIENNKLYSVENAIVKYGGIDVCECEILEKFQYKIYSEVTDRLNDYIIRIKDEEGFMTGWQKELHKKLKSSQI